MKYKDKISVIIPVYNVEKYLDQCIESVVRQTYENLEIILVDDGSEDQSGFLCDIWKEKDDRIQVLHRKNSGSADARNAGIAVASGDFISFVDADDVIYPEMYSRLYTILINTNAQISCCEALSGSSFDLIQKYDGRGLVQQFHTREAMKALVLEKGITVMVWGKLYCKETIEGILFESGKYIDDEFWMYRVIDRADIVVSIDSKLYCYRQRVNSQMNRKYSFRHLDVLDARVSRIHFLEKAYPELLAAARCNLRFECIRAYQLCVLNMSGQDLADGKRKARMIANAYPLTYRDYRILPHGRQFWCVLSGISFTATCYIRNWLHFGP